MKNVNVYNVKKFTKVDTTLYSEGSLFIEEGTGKVGVLANSKIKQINGSIPSMYSYVKKEEVEKMIKDILKKEE